MRNSGNWKKVLFLMLLFVLFIQFNATAIDGFFIGYKGGLLLKVDVASAFQPKPRSMSIPTGIGEYGATTPHGFPRVLEAIAAPYGEMIFFFGYKFPRVFSLGFGHLMSNFVMHSLMVDFKFTFIEDKRVRPYATLGIYGGYLDGFPIGITAAGGVDIFFDDHFFFLIESKVGAEIFVARYYDDGINSNPIWHWDSVYAYALFGIYLGVGYQFKNKLTDENGKWIGKEKK